MRQIYILKVGSPAHLKIDGKLHREGKIGLEEALTNADNPSEVKMRLKGIERIQEERK